MARAESKQILGYLPTSLHHYEAILSLVSPANPATRILDPYAGEGEFLEAAAQAWNVTPYANELDGERAQKCIERFGPTQAVRCDVERLVASNEAFGILWANPPYDHDKLQKASKRVEFAYLRYAWKWAADGAIIFWVVYHQHLTEDAAAFLAKNSTRVDVWALPGKHLNEYDQIIVAAIKGAQPEPDALYNAILRDKAEPRSLTVQAEPLYRVPPPPDPNRKFVFAPDVIDEAQGLRLITEGGAWRSNAFQALLQTPPPPSDIEPVVAPRPGHLALVLAAGVADGAVIETADYGRVAIRGKTQHVEQIARMEIEAAPGDPERQVKKTTIRLKPTTTLTLLSADGTTVEMEGDEALLNFITANKSALAGYLNTRFKPMYAFDFAGVGRWLDRIRLKGKHTLYTAQKHVIGAVACGFQSRDSILLVGQMGVGKTAIGGAAAIAMAAGVVQQLTGDMRPDQVVLIVAPPHLVEKWQRELHSISPNIVVERLDRHEDIKRFMDKSARIGTGVAKIGLIKRDLAKLGCPWDGAVRWRETSIPLWRYGAPVPEGYEAHQRLHREKLPHCPTCGSIVMQEKKGTSVPASRSWLESGQRTCTVCLSPLWQEARDRGSRPKGGEKYPSKNPRYRIDEYLKRLYRDRVYLLVWDEVHEAQHGDTGNGEAFGRMAGIARKVLAMTGTPFNGRSSSLFNLEYHLNRRVRQRYNRGGAPRLSRKTRGERGFQSIISDDSKQRGRAESRWVADMGVREMVVEERPSYDRETGAFTGTTTYQRPYEEAPGISPLLVAEVLDHAIFFSLGDLGKCLPQFEEVALPVEMDADVYSEYDRTRQRLKDYLIQRRWEGDVSFRGAYLQWAMGWVNALFRPEQVIHNLKHPITGEKQPYTVVSIPCYGEDRIFAKEQALIDLVQAELADGRPCVIYLRQTSTRDIQARIERLIREHVPGSQPFILKNTVDAERREAVIEAEVTKGTNVVICNPELVKTGLDLLHFPTLIFHELVFNLGTLMQAAARSYRLNQTHQYCKVYYLFYEGTMEATAVQLMSRKQRAAKLLTGDIGLTGLDALTEGEGGFEQALLDAIGRDEALLDPATLFKSAADATEIADEDAAYWNVAADIEVPSTPTESLEADPLVALAVELGAVVTRETPRVKTPYQHDRVQLDSVEAYLDRVHILNDKQWMKLKAHLLAVLAEGTDEVIGMRDSAFLSYPTHEEALTAWLTNWLRTERVVFTGCEAEVAAQIIERAKAAFVAAPIPEPVLPSGASTSHVPSPVFILQQRETPVRRAKSAPRLAAAAKGDELPQQLALF
jgi:superfamily II DNA or RNA helicase/16S rRNA G966 N2-methylase RsmD